MDRRDLPPIPGQWARPVRLEPEMPHRVERPVPRGQPGRAAPPEQAAAVVAAERLGVEARPVGVAPRVPADRPAPEGRVEAPAVLGLLALPVRTERMAPVAMAGAPPTLRPTEAVTRRAELIRAR